MPQKPYKKASGHRRKIVGTGVDADAERKRRNRDAARELRARKLHYVAELEKQATAIQQEVADLRGREALLLEKARDLAVAYSAMHQPESLLMTPENSPPPPPPHPLTFLDNDAFGICDDFLDLELPDQASLECYGGSYMLAAIDSPFRPAADVPCLPASTDVTATPPSRVGSSVALSATSGTTRPSPHGLTTPPSSPTAWASLDVSTEPAEFDRLTQQPTSRPNKPVPPSCISRTPMVLSLLMVILLTLAKSIGRNSISTKKMTARSAGTLKERSSLGVRRPTAARAPQSTWTLPASPTWCLPRRTLPTTVYSRAPNGARKFRRTFTSSDRLRSTVSGAKPQPFLRRSRTRTKLPDHCPLFLHWEVSGLMSYSR